MNAAIRAEALNKCYLPPTSPEGVDSVVSRIFGSFNRPCKTSVRDQRIWGLRDVSFEIQRGECVGVIGMPGSGKSTLVKILIGVTEPTSGRVIVEGRLGVLRGYGRDLHPDLTLRENVLLAGAALGMTHGEILRRLNDKAFVNATPADAEAEVGSYSQKKRMRLAFAIAAHLDADILVVDELGTDREFQRRSLAMLERLNREGRTIVFVSHHLSDVLSRCTRTIWLHEGRVAGVGTTGEILEQYQRVLETA